MTLTADLNHDLAATLVTLAGFAHPTAYIYREIVSTGVVTPVRDAEPATLTGGGFVVTDHEAPVGEEFYYRAVSGVDQMSSPIYVLNRVDTTRAWLKHLGDPALSQQVRIEVAPEISRPATVSLASILGRATPVSVSSTRGSARGSLDVVTMTFVERTALLDLLADGSVLLLQAQSEYNIGTNAYVSIEDVRQQPFPKRENVPCKWSLGFTVVERPAGGVQISNTWGALLGAYATWADVMVAPTGFPTATWNSVLQGLVSAPLGPTP